MTTPGAPLPSIRVLLERAVHDLKNPLAVVRATLEWLDAEIGPAASTRPTGVNPASPEDVMEAVRDASDATSRLGTIIDHLHTLARIVEPGGVHLETLDVAELVVAAKAIVAGRSSTRGRSFTVVLRSAVTRVDKQLVTDALTAVLEAAARHTPPDSELQVRIDEDEGAFEVVVSAHEDAGVEPQASGTLPGSGLGLLFARAVLEAHDGALGVASGSRAVRVVARLPKA